MPQLCTVCTHTDRQQIDLALVRGRQSNRRIAAQFQLTERAVRNHRGDHLPATLQHGYEAKREAEALAVLTELERCVRLTNKVLSACDEWLTDPDDPTRYTLEPRIEEITVIYSESNGDGKPKRKRAPLSQLLARIEKTGPSVEGWETKRADPRELILKAVAQLRPQAELLAKLEGKLADNPQINILINPQWVEVRGALLEALGPYKEARAAVAEALAGVESNSNGNNSGNHSN